MNNLKNRLDNIPNINEDSKDCILKFCTTQEKEKIVNKWLFFVENIISVERTFEEKEIYIQDFLFFLLPTKDSPITLHLVDIGKNIIYSYQISTLSGALKNLEEKEKTIVQLESQQNKQLQQLESYKNNLLSVLGIFISIFSLITINLQLFSSQKMDFSSLTRILLTINTILITALYTLIKMIKSLFSTSKRIDFIIVSIILISFFVISKL